ncbi:GPN-loop GTPase QQT1-like isoform X4 [Pyrus communis]|uniref:GPN-loop GTPase QQT1-like isoform X4 n=1 Tax=Pyrus communis TaxID=23211 RepID=UPI0035C24291
MVFGQVVIGPPGLGKTTYCNGMSELLQLIGRKVVVVNLDHSTDALLYPMSYVEVQSRFGDFEMVDAGPVTLLQDDIIVDPVESPEIVDDPFQTM